MEQTREAPKKSSSNDSFTELNLELPDEDLKEHIGDEVFLLSCNIIRYNKYGWKNVRTLCLTQENIMVLKRLNKSRKELRLKVPYHEVKGVTISLHANSNEIVCHLDMQADIRMAQEQHKKHIVDTIKLFYATKTHLNLPVYGVRQKSLSMYTTQECDV